MDNNINDLLDYEKGKKLESFIDPTKLTKWLIYLLYAKIVFLVIASVSNILEYDLLTKASEGIFPTESEANANDDRQKIFGIIQLSFVVIIGILFLKWIYRANKNVRELGAKELTNTPGWSIGWYFIPIANLWKPFKAMKEIYLASEDVRSWQKEISIKLLNIWWGLWIISSIINNVLFRLSIRAESIDELIVTSLLTILSDIIEIPLCIVAAKLVKKIYIMQMEQLKNIETNVEEQI